MNAFWGLVASNAVVASVLALVALVLGRIWKNAAAIHVLWVVVLLKLFTPPLVTAELPFAFSSPPPAAVDSRERAPDFASARDDGLPSPVDSTDPRGSASASEGQYAGRDRSRPEMAGRRGWSPSPSAILAAIWLGGSCLTAMVYAAGIRRFLGLIGEFEPPPPAVRLMVAQLSGRLGLGRVPEALMTSRALPPLVWSVGTSPRLILPSRLFARLGREAQSTILAHELIHIRRGDHLVRLLELAATVVFWWHPVAWLAGRQLRELEEECCDGRVLELLPGRPRAYAAAMVDTLEFLSGGLRAAAPLRTAIDPARSLSRRIRMLTQRRTTRLNAASAALVFGIVAIPLGVALAAGPRQQAGKAAEAKPPAGAPVATLHGRVTTKAGAPLPGARVRIAIPAADMRFVDGTTEHARVEAKSDADGEYQVRLPGIAGPTKVSIDAMMPGFRRLSGTLMMGGDNRTAEVRPGETVEANLALEPARYFGGIVVDEQGQPIAGAKVGAHMTIGRGSGGVERTATGPDGTFELFNYFIDPPHPVDAEPGKGIIGFSHPDYIEARIEDAYAIDPARRGDLKVVLPTGRKVAGTVLDAAGRPARGVMVEVALDPQGHRKATVTDADGKFTLRGLESGPSTLAATSLEIKQKARLPIALDGDKADLEVRLRPIALPADLKKYSVLGMQLADVTPDLKSAYDLHHDRGAVILDPGPDPARLDIGDLAEGCMFWIVGQKRIGSVREFVDQILAEAGEGKGEKTWVRVVYTFKTTDFVGTNTQYLKLTKDDLKQLQAASDRLKADPK